MASKTDVPRDIPLPALSQYLTARPAEPIVTSTPTRPRVEIGSGVSLPRTGSNLSGDDITITTVGPGFHSTIITTAIVTGTTTVHTVGIASPVTIRTKERPAPAAALPSSSFLAPLSICAPAAALCHAIYWWEVGRKENDARVRSHVLVEKGNC